MKKYIVLLLVFLQLGCASDTYYFNNNKKVTLKAVDTISRSVTSLNYYKNEKGTLLGVGNTLIIKVINDDNLDTYLNDFELTLLSSLGTYIYLLETKNKDLTLAISNSLHEKEDVLYSHPNFLRKKIKR